MAQKFTKLADAYNTRVIELLNKITLLNARQLFIEYYLSTGAIDHPTAFD